MQVSRNLVGGVAGAIANTARPGYARMKKLSECPPDGGPESHLIGIRKRRCAS
jgi:hypothetical protein